MKLLSRTFAGLSLLAMMACTSPDRFGAGGGAGGAGGAGLGGPNDPNSIAYFQQTVGDRVLFAVDESTLNTTARLTLDGQVAWLNANPEFTVVIEGHADEQGTREYNIALGGRRANSVQEYLVSQGVSAGRIQVISYGKERPIEICSDETCYSKNRRAVTVVTAGTTS